MKLTPRYSGSDVTTQTILSSIVINYLQNSLKDERTPVIFIYFNHKDSLDQTLPNLIGSLLKQLVQFRAPAPPSESIKKLWEVTMQKETPDLDELARTLRSELESFDRVFLIVDALDECPTDVVRSKLLEILKDLQETNLSLMITSRPIENKFGPAGCYCDRCGKHDLRYFYHCTICNFGDYDLCEECIKNDEKCLDGSHRLLNLYACIRISIEATKADLQKYIELKVDKESRLKSICLKDKKIESKIIEGVIGAAEGMFLIAKLLVDSLKTKATPKALLRTLETLPTTLDDIYEDALLRIQKQDEDDAAIAKKILSWVFWSRRALSVDELLHALAVSPEDDDFDTGELLDEGFLCSVTAGLITTDYKRCVQLVHYTTQKYFEKNKERWFPNARAEIATTTLTYLNFESFAEPCQGNEEDEKLDARLQEFPFLVYASEHWGEHAREFYSLKPEIRKAVFTLVRNPLRLASSIQAAWYSGSSWDVRKGINSLHVCAWFGLDDLITDILKQGPSIDSQDPVYRQTPLMYACKRGHASTTMKLLELGASVNLRSARESTALFEAVEANQVDIVALLLKNTTIDVNAKHTNLYNRTALSLSVLYELDDIIKLLLERPDILVNEKDVHGWTALAFAAQATVPTYLEILLSHKDCNINCADNELRTPLMIAAETGLEKNVNVLLECRADPYLKDMFGGTAILRAIDYGHISTVKTMMLHGVDIHDVDYVQRTLLHGASINGKLEIVKLLIAAGLDVNARGNRGETPLHDAARMGYGEIAKVLLENGADHLMIDSVGRTPLIVAEQNGCTNVVQILQSQTAKETSEEGDNYTQSKVPIWAMAGLGMKQDIQNFITNNGNLGARNPDSGEDSLHVATWAQDVELMEILLDAGMDANSTNNYLRTSLHLCAIRDLVEGTKLLIDHDARLDEEDMWGKTALAIAQDSNYFSVAIELIAAGAKIDTHTEPIQPTFFAAVKVGNAKAVKRLITHGADLQALDFYGYTALQLAKMRDQTEVIQILRQHKSFYIPSRTVSQRSESSPANSPPAYPNSTTEPFKPRPEFEEHGLS